MRRLALLSIIAAVTAALVGADLAEAARVGSGRNLGAQRQSIAPPTARTPATPAAPQAAPGAASQPVMPGAAPNPVMPAQPGAAAAARPAAPAATPAPASGMSRWLGPIAGLAAGIGLAALMSHLGLSEAFGNFLMIALLVLAVVVVLRLLLAKRSRAPMQYAGQAPAGAAPTTGPATDIGNWGQSNRVEPVLAPGSTAGTTPPAPVRVPAGFDTEGFVRQAKLQFRQLQAAWDAGDRRALENVMTAELFAELARDLAERVGTNVTEVISLEAQIIEVVTEGDRHWASVRFTGVIRENGSESRSLDETWNLSKPVDGSSGWLLAGIEQNIAATTAH